MKYRFEDREVPIWEHIEELRSRLIKCFVIFMVLFILIFPFSGRIILLVKNYALSGFSKYIHHAETGENYAILLVRFVNSSHYNVTKIDVRRALEMLGGKSLAGRSGGAQSSPVNIIVKDPLEALWVEIQVSMVLAFFLGLPFYFYQLMMFVFPALYPHERRFLLSTLIPLVVLFVLGALFSYFVLVPVSLGFLYRLSLVGGQPIALPFYTLGELLKFIAFMSVAMGIFFEMPLVVGILSKFGLLYPDTLEKYRKHAIVVLLIIAGVVTPDPTFFSQIVMFVPLYILYEISILISKIAVRKSAGSESSSD